MDNTTLWPHASFDLWTVIPAGLFTQTQLSSYVRTGIRGRFFLLGVVVILLVGVGVGLDVSGVLFRKDDGDDGDGVAKDAWT